MGLDPSSLRIISCGVCVELGSGIALVSAPARAPYTITRNERLTPFDACGFPDYECQAARVRASDNSSLCSLVTARVVKGLLEPFHRGLGVRAN